MLVDRGVPPGYLRLLVEGVASDLDRCTVASWTDLREYCFRVASSVGLAMGLSRWWWRSVPPNIPPGFPLTAYLLNLGFAVVLSAAGDVWVPIGVALAATLAAAALAWRGSSIRLRTRPAA